MNLNAVRQVIARIAINSLLILLLAYVFHSCNSGNSKTKDVYMRQNCKNVDSIWIYFLNKDGEGLKSEFIMNKVEQLSAQPTLKDSAEKLMKRIQQFSKNKPDPQFLCYYYTLQKKMAFQTGDMKSAWNWHAKRVPFEPFATINNRLADDVLYGNMMYFNSSIDSAIEIFQRALNFATKHKDTFYKQTILINLGTAYFEVGYYGAASSCFSQAAILNFPTHEYKQVLYTNLLASLNAEAKYSEVIKVVNKNRDVLQSKDGRQDLQQLFRLNYISALINTKASPVLIKSQIDTVEQGEINDYNKNFYLFLKGRYFRVINDLKSFQKLYLTNLSFIYESQPKSVSDHTEGIKFGLEKGLFKVDFDQFLNEYKKLEPSETNYLLMSNYAELFRSIKQNQGDINSAREWEQKRDKFLIKISEVSDELRNSNIQQEMEKVRIMQILDEQKYKIEKAELKQNWLLALSVVFGALLISTALFLYQFNVNRKKQLNILKLESELKEKELELLKQNQEKQQNTIFTSKLILNKIEELIQKIKNSNLSSNPTMVDIKIELERMIRVDLPDDSISAEESDVFERYHYLTEKYSSLTELNTTTYKILVLSILDNAPKDIANLLNLNMQYVRNVRSKLKKELSEELGEDWDWPDLA